MGDILQISLAKIFARKKIKLAGNLPYNIATQVLLSGSLNGASIFPPWF